MLRRKMEEYSWTSASVSQPDIITGAQTNPHLVRPPTGHGGTVWFAPAGALLQQDVVPARIPSSLCKKGEWIEERVSYLRNGATVDS